MTDLTHVHATHRRGSIEVICGPMFSGKTEELIRRLRRAQIARQRVTIVKPALDRRYSVSHLVSHSSLTIPSALIDGAAAIREHAAGADVVGIDEAQFLGAELIPTCEDLADRGVRVIVAGLDQDYLGQPFEPIPQLLAIAEYITKTLAICVVCGEAASRTQRTVQEDSRVAVGATDKYEARCRGCFRPPYDAPTPMHEIENGASAPAPAPAPALGGAAR